jgi:hypothetical protein
VAAELKPICGAATAEDGWDQLRAFEEKWDARYPSISQIWKRNWDQVRPFFCVPGGNPEGDLHHQRDRVAEYEAAQGDQDARFLSQTKRRR